MKFVIATNNAGKLREMREILAGLGLETVSQAEAGIDVEVEETGATFIENATLKAEAACKATGLPAIADDSGLVVEALGGAPGVHSKRYGGGGLSEGGLYAYLLQKMNGLEQRSAKFVSSIVCVFPDGRLLSAEGECAGAITGSPRGSGGFGYDPVFQPEGSSRTMAELSPAEKNAISHRGKALRSFKEALRIFNGGKIMRIGILGGTFNPPHTGHIGLAKDAMAGLALDRLIIVPAGIPPHKDIPKNAPSAEMRLHMTRMAFAEVPNTDVSDIEIMASDVCYSVDTVAAISAGNPGASVYLLVGSDMYLTLDTWKDAEILLREAKPAVLSRGDDEARKISEYSHMLKARYGVDTEIVRNTFIDISSSELRAMLPKREGAGYIIDAIYAYIIKNRLYGAKPDWDWLRGKAYEMLKPSRIPHVAGCEKEALELAKKWGVDSDETREAAILHDMTKKLNADEHTKLLDESGYRGDRPGLGDEKLFHSITGALAARERFGVSDEVAEAIKWHTTGKPGMSALEKIIYIADYIEPTRDDEGIEGIDELRALAYSDLDEALALGFRMSIRDMRERGIEPNRTTYDALAYLTGETP